MTDAIYTRLRQALGDSAVRRDGFGTPRAIPPSSEAVAEICGLAHEQGWRVRVEGQGTWMPPDAPADLALSTEGLDRISEIAPADLVATVEAGVGLGRLGIELARRGAWLPLDPPGLPRRSLGSLVATGTAGPLRHGFGPVRDHILGATFVTGDGRVLTAGGKVVKNVAGYDLTRLQVGAFGAFGVVTRVHIRLRALSAARVMLMAIGPRDALTRQARSLMDGGLSAAALELRSPGPGGGPDWSLGLELAGTEAGVEAEAARSTSQSEVAWTRLDPDRAARFRSEVALAPLTAPTTFRIGVLPDGLDEMLDVLEGRLGPGVISAGPGRGLVRWSGEPTFEALRDLRGIAAEREMPLTLERGPWDLRQAIGHFGAYREGVGPLVSRLRETFDPDPTFAVALGPGKTEP